MSGKGDKANFDAFVAELSAPNEVDTVLPLKLVQAVAHYLHDELFLTSVAELRALGPDSALAAFNEALGGKGIPKSLEGLVVSWLLEKTPSSAAAEDLFRKTTHKPGAAGVKLKFAADADDDDWDTTSVFGSSGGGRAALVEKARLSQGYHKDITSAVVT